MTLADFTNERMVLPRLQGRDVTGVLQELSQLLQREGKIREALPFYQAALNREFLVSTEIEGGLALPHARMPGLEQVSFTFGRSETALTWGGNWSPSVRLVFLIAVPATDATQYLSLISGLARLTKDKKLYEQLFEAKDALEIINLFQQVNIRTQRPSLTATQI